MMDGAKVIALQKGIGWSHVQLDEITKLQKSWNWEGKEYRVDVYFGRLRDGRETPVVIMNVYEQGAGAKYDFIIERTNAIVGTITDASNLRIGAKGDLNGYIIGERGTAKVETIGAGGYNIQCFHFRTLIHGMK